MNKEVTDYAGTNCTVPGRFTGAGNDAGNAIPAGASWTLPAYSVDKIIVLYTNAGASVRDLIFCAFCTGTIDKEESGRADAGRSSGAPYRICSARQAILSTGVKATLADTGRAIPA